MWKLFVIIKMVLVASQVAAQSNYLPVDTLSNNDIKLELINFRYGHTYQFKTTITNDSIFWIMPRNLPKGYYEAYYNNDTNKLALIFYNSGAKTYGQQFYANGAMKSDTEYSKEGDLHGLHVLYDRKGEEVWHAEYNFGILDYRYDLNYLEEQNQTELLIQKKEAFGWYEFIPTPSRGRRDRIHLKEDGTFVYEYSTNSCFWCNRRSGAWKLKDRHLILELKDNTIWRTAYRKMAITATPQLTRLELIEVKDWGVEWYNSEYEKVKEPTIVDTK